MTNARQEYNRGNRGARTIGRPATCRRMRCPRWARLGGIALGLLVAAAGCNRKPQPVPVHGTVTLDGKPVAAAAVMFEPVAGGPVGSAVTDAQGVYTLMTANQAGAFPGQYRATVVKQITTGVNADETVGPLGPQIQWIVPQRYNNAKTAELTVDVQAGQQDYPLVLTTAKKDHP